MENEDELEHIAVESREMKKAVALSISSERICAGLQKQVDNVIVAFMGGPDDGRSREWSSLGVDINALLDKIFAQRVVVIYRRQLWLWSAYYQTFEAPTAAHM